MKKKLLIALGVILSVIIIITILCFTLFTISDVSLKFWTSQNILLGKNEQILKSYEFSYGSCIFFQNKGEITGNLEKNNPYLKVINIETVFPSKFVLHVAEREGYFQIEKDGKFLTLDNELKILEIRDIANDNLINLSTFSLLNSVSAEGEFLDIEQRAIYGLSSAWYENNRTLSEQRALMKEISFGTRFEETEKAEKVFIKLVDREGYETFIYNADKNLNLKIQRYMAVMSVMKPSDKVNSYLKIADLFNGGVYFEKVDK